MEVAYYPGCSLESSAKEYQLSAGAVCEQLGIELVEIEDWNCCGALEVSSFNRILSLALPARNLKIASESSNKLLVSCNACLNNLMSVQHTLSIDDELNQKVSRILDWNFREIEITHLLDLIWNEVGLEKIGERVEKPLKELKTVSYYGCLSVRPSKVMKSEDPETPTHLDEIISILGGEPQEFTHKTKCCGGGLLMTYRNTALKLTEQILTETSQRGAQCIVVTCPLCHMTLETLTDKVKTDPGTHRVPILFFTQLMGLSFGIEPKKLGLQRNLVSTEPVINSIV
jgi:heterodisulfide reductase subunit B